MAISHIDPAALDSSQMATSYDCHIANGDYFSIPCSAKRSPHIATSATSATYWDNTLYSEFSLPSSDSTMPSPTSPNSVSFPPRHYSLPDLYHGQRKPDDALGPHPYESFMQWEVTPDNTMDPSLSHFFPELKLENTFSPAMGGLKNQPNPMPMGIPVTDNMMSETIHDPASVSARIQSRRALCLTRPPSTLLPSMRYNPGVHSIMSLPSNPLASREWLDP